MPFSRHDPPPDAVPARALRDAVARGVITDAQHAAILALAGVNPQPAADGGGLESQRAGEAPRGFNWVTVAYAAGAAAVLFAFGWFLIDRWAALGPAGVLLVALLYAAIFATTAVQLHRHGFRVATGVATVLAVEMTPLATWALLQLAGLWPGGRRPPFCDLLSPVFFACNGKWMIVELASIGAALAALRYVKFAELAAPIAVALLMLTFHLAEALLGTPLRELAWGWTVVGSASLVLAVAYAVDRGQGEGGEDYAWWLYAAGLVATFAGMFELWERAGGLRHFLLAAGVVALAVSLYLRRRAFLAFGAATLVWYLGYLAFDVFRETLAFPLLLATFGISVIIGTVLLQRSYPRLTARLDARLGTSAGARRRPVAGFALFLAPLVLAVLSMPVARERDRQREAERRVQEATWRREMAERQQAGRVQR
jgi:hypothetical protein